MNPHRPRALRWPGDQAALTAEGVDFEAVAHVLANTCCWRGRTRRFYSLAQHALTVCTGVQALGGMSESDRGSLALHALLGEAWRAWLGEPPQADASAKAMEKRARERERIQRTVLEAAGAKPELPGSWTQALDLTRRMADAAVHRDFSDAGIEWDARDGGPLFQPLRPRIRPMRPEQAARRWLEAFEGLRPAVLRTAERRTAEQRAADRPLAGPET